MSRLSGRVRAVVPSATLDVAARARALRARGVDVISFGTGEPDFETPAHVREAAIAAMQGGATGYPPLSGIAPLKEAIAARLLRDQGLSFGLDGIAVTVGAKQALYGLCQALLDEGDEAVIPTPSWVSYPDMVRLAGGRPVLVPGDPAAGFDVDVAGLAGAIGPRTRLLFLNTPCNPTGRVLSPSTLQGIAEVVRRHPELVVVSDEVYQRILFDGRVFTSLAQVAPDLQDRIVLVGGPSKSHAMTGWRIGWAAGPPDLVDGMLRVQGQSTSGATHFAQYGALAALTGDDSVVEAMVAAFERRRDLMVGRLRRIPGVACALPEGAFYALPDVRALLGRRVDGQVLGDTATFCRVLLEREGLAAVPGAPFGAEGFLRLSFATSSERIEAGLERLERFVRQSV